MIIHVDLDRLFTPLELLEAWFDESCRAVAPRRRVAELDALRGNPAQ